MERCEGTTGVDQFVRIERRKWPLLSKPCTAIAKAMDRTAEGEAQLLLRARSDETPVATLRGRLRAQQRRR